MIIAARDSVEKNQFRICHREFTQQYSHIYFCRLKQIKPALLEKAHSKWTASSSGYSHCERVLDSQVNCQSFLLGTIYVEQPERRGILDEIALEYQLEKQSISCESTSYYSKDSLVFLEDEHARIQLFLPADCHFITGSVVAVAGVERENGQFEVHDWTFAGLPAQEPTKEKDLNVSNLLLVSGLKYNLSEGSSAAALQFEMLKDLCVGNFGYPSGLGEIDGLVLCGNSLLEPPRFVDDMQKKRFGATNYKYDTNHFKCFSHTLAQILQAGKEVCLVPGATDPTNISLPQQPIHQALLKEATQAASSCQNGNKLYLETNPAFVEINGLLCLLMDGQTVLDAQKHTPGHSVQQVIEYLLLSRHIAPTAPDTLCKHFYAHF
jgi:DNA polymerase delta subunit 2